MNNKELKALKLIQVQIADIQRKLEALQRLVSQIQLGSGTASEELPTQQRKFVIHPSNLRFLQDEFQDSPNEPSPRTRS